MRALRILMMIVGILVLLGGLLASIMFGSVMSALGGAEGPVDGKVTDVSGQQVTVQYTTKDGKEISAKGTPALKKSAKEGDTVEVHYLKSSPKTPFIGDFQLIKDSSRNLLIGGIVAAVIGIALIVGAIIMGRRDKRKALERERLANESLGTSNDQFRSANEAGHFNRDQLKG